MKRLNALSMEHDRRRRMTRVLRVAELYQRGVPMADIAREYEIALPTVAKYARAMGVAKRRPGNVPEVRAAVARDYAAGAPTRAICAAHGVDRKTLWVICKQAGLALRRPRTKENAA